MEPKVEHPFFETSAVYGAGLAVFMSVFLVGSLLLFGDSLSGLLLACLGCCGLVFAPGLLSIRAQVKNSGQTLELGRGALIGFVTGIIFAIVLSFMEVIWGFFSINSNQLFFEALINFAREYGDDNAVRDIEDAFEQSGGTAGGFSILGFIFNALVIGMLNLISGMVATSIFKGDNTLEI